MFGEESVPKIFSGDRITVSVDTRKAVIDLASLEVRYIYPFSRKPSYHLSTQVSCTEDSTFQQIVQTAVSKLHQSLVPLQFDKWELICPRYFLPSCSETCFANYSLLLNQAASGKSKQLKKIPSQNHQLANTERKWWKLLWRCETIKFCILYRGIVMHSINQRRANLNINVEYIPLLVSRRHNECPWQSSLILTHWPPRETTPLDC